MKEYLKHNQRAWDLQVQKKNKWTVPVSTDEITQAKKGVWQVLLTPWKPVPSAWFPDLESKNVLCLASAGGQQGPILSAAGANVIVYDLSTEQLKQDQTVAKKESLTLQTIQGDMSDLSRFPDQHFDLIFHPVSNCFVHDIQPVWQESYRILKSGGTLLAGFTNPLLYLFDESNPNITPNLEIVHTIPYSDLEKLSNDQKEFYIRDGIPFEFGHTLEDQIGGQIAAGFIIDGFYEDKHNPIDHPIYKHISTFMATRASKP